MHLPKPRRAAPRLLVAGLAALVGLGLALTPARAFAYCRTTTTPTNPSYRPEVSGCFVEGRSLYWPSRCLTVEVQEKGGPLGDAVTKPLVERAFGAWTRTNGACTPGLDVDVTGAREVPDDAVAGFCEGDEVHNVVGFQESGWPSNARGTLALTTLTFDIDTGEIFGADTTVNATFIEWSTDDALPDGAHDLESALVHEAGHFLGVAHSPVRDATMFADYQPGTSELRTLEPDDEEAICVIYPAADRRTRGQSGGSDERVASSVCDPEAALRPSVCAPSGGEGCGCRVARRRGAGSPATTASSVPSLANASADAGSLTAVGVLAVAIGASRRRRSRGRPPASP